MKKYTSGDQGVTSELEDLKKHCSVIRVLAHTQMSKVGLKQKKAHMMEIQVSLWAVEGSGSTHPCRQQLHAEAGCQAAAACVGFDSCRVSGLGPCCRCHSHCSCTAVQACGMLLKRDCSCCSAADWQTALQTSRSQPRLHTAGS